jgi:hypothetical protein
VHEVSHEYDPYTVVIHLEARTCRDGDPINRDIFVIVLVRELR